jgi:hypothetical protein
MFRFTNNCNFLRDALANRCQSTLRPTAVGTSPFRRRLSIERLEDRRLLATITVDTLVDGTGVPGTSLREAIAAAAANDTINFSVTGTINLISTGQLTINKNLTITGPGANLLTIQAYNPSPTAGNGSRVFNVDDGSSSNTRTVSISGLTLTGGDANANGGAIRNLENLTVTNSVISGSATTGNGGGIYSANHNLVVTGSTISGNSAKYGGGIFCDNGTLTVTGSTISGNSATTADGGGIYTKQCPANVTSSTISGNAAAGDGGGIFGDATTVTVTSSTINGNTAVDGGGGINNGYGTLTVTDSTISGNQAKMNGGGLYVDHGSVTVNHSTITLNQADSDNNGSGVGGGLIDVSPTTRAYHHTIIAGNIRGASTRSDASGQIELQYSLIGDNTGATVTNTGGNLIGTTAAPINPLLGPLANNGGPTLTHALLAGSPAIDAGNAAAVAGSGGVPQYDQRGTPNGRVADGDGAGGARIDIGAFEVQVQVNHSPTNPAAVTLSAINEDIPNSSNTGTLVSAIVTASGSTDSDGNNLGIAITAADNSHGQWQYSTNGGGAWSDLTSLSISSARLLAPAHLVRFVPNANFNSQLGASPTISFKVWDQTSGTAGSTADTTSDSAYSTSAAQATLPVTAVNDEQVLATNNPLSVDRGASAVITTAFLQTTDVDNTDSQLLYTVTSAATHGTLLVSSTPVTQFTQQQISAGLVSYQHDGTATLADSFGFSVDDGAGTSSSGTFQITIRPFAGDYNGNRIVDAGDFVLYRKTQGATGLTAYSGADGDGNTTVGPGDYGVWRANFGNAMPSGAGSGAASGASVEAGPGSGQEVNSSAVDSLPATGGGKIQNAILLATADQAKSGTLRRTGSSGARSAVAEESHRDDALVAWLCARDSATAATAIATHIADDPADVPSSGEAVDDAIDTLGVELQPLLV